MVIRLNQNNVHAALKYHNVSNYSCHFSSSIVKILIENRRTGHTERINNSRNLVLFYASDIVMARITIQSDFFKNKVAKSSYSVRGPYNNHPQYRFW